MSIKRGLGKGLDSMIPSRLNLDLEKKDISNQIFVKITEIEPNKGQPRKNFNEETIQELAESIKKYGVIQPLILTKKEKFYEIVAGERRWRAAKLAELKEVPAIIKNCSEREVVEIALIENLQREDLNPIEEAHAYEQLINEFNLKQEELAQIVFKSKPAISNAIRLLKLDDRVKQMLIDEMITSGHARTLVVIDDNDLQYEIATKIYNEKLNVRETEKLVKSINNKKDKDTKKDIVIDKGQEIIYKDIEEKIKTIIGTKVSINRKNKNRGKIEIEYYSDEELERIIDLFMSIKE